MNVNQTQAEKEQQEFIDLLKKAYARNDGSFLAVVAAVSVDTNSLGLLNGYSMEDYCKALKALQWGMSVTPHHKASFQAAIDYICSTFLNEGVNTDG